MEKYLNEEINGLGKEYNKNGKLIFEGEFKYGEKWNGKAKELYKNKILIIEGKILNEK